MARDSWFIWRTCIPIRFCDMRWIRMVFSFTPSNEHRAHSYTCTLHSYNLARQSTIGKFQQYWYASPLSLPALSLLASNYSVLAAVLPWVPSSLSKRIRFAEEVVSSTSVSMALNPLQLPLTGTACNSIWIGSTEYSGQLLSTLNCKLRSLKYKVLIVQNVKL